MQHKDDNTFKVRKALGEVFKAFREDDAKITRNKLEDEYELGKNTIKRIEDALYDCKFITAWKVSESVGVKLSDVVKRVEDKLGKDFSLIER